MLQNSVSPPVSESRDGPQQRREVRVRLQRAVEVPEQRALEIFGALVHVFVEGDLVDPVLSLVGDDVAQRLGDGDLLRVADVQATEENDPALREGGANVLRLAAAAQRVEVGPDFAADPGRAVDDIELGR